MLASVLYIALRRLLQLVALACRSEEFKELEIVVLRHELVKGANIRVAGSSGVSVVLVDESAEAVTATDFADSRCRRWLRTLRRQEFERAMRPLRVVGA